jgi:hypothetical protein
MEILSFTLPNALADLLRADLVSESYVPDKEHRALRQLVRTRTDLVRQRTAVKEKIHAILSKYEYEKTCPTSDVLGHNGIDWLRTKIQISWVDQMAMDSLVSVGETLSKQGRFWRLTRRSHQFQRKTKE